MYKSCSYIARIHHSYLPFHHFHCALLEPIYLKFHYSTWPVLHGVIRRNRLLTVNCLVAIGQRQDLSNMWLEMAAGQEIYGLVYRGTTRNPHTCHDTLTRLRGDWGG